MSSFALTTVRGPYRYETSSLLTGIESRPRPQVPRIAASKPLCGFPFCANEGPELVGLDTLGVDSSNVVVMVLNRDRPDLPEQPSDGVDPDLNNPTRRPH